MGVPGHETDSLADIGTRVDAVCLEELVLLVPQFLVYLLFQVVSFVEIGLSLVVVARQLGDIANSLCVAIHVGIDRRAQVFFLATT